MVKGGQELTKKATSKIAYLIRKVTVKINIMRIISDGSWLCSKTVWVHGWE
jgi:hypothetical protein